MKFTWKICLVTLLTAAATAQGADEKKKDPAVAEHAENPLLVDATTQKQLGILVAPVESQSLVDELKAPGEVKANAYGTALVSTRIPAHIVRRHAKLGDAVKAGQPLVTLSSVEVAEAQGTLIVAEREWQRVRQLGAEAFSAKRYTEAQVARDQAFAKLRAYGVSDGEIATLEKQGSNRANGEFVLTAPQAGRVTIDDFVVGERVEPGKALFTVVDESRVWIEAQFAPDNAEHIQAGDAVRVQAHDQTIVGQVVQLSHRTQEASRTTPVRIEVPNDADALHPGEFVETFVATKASHTVLAVPNEAIVQVQGQPAVFKVGTNGEFEVVPIQTAETRGAHTAVKQGLAEGDRIAVKGAYALKARLLKSQLGEGHAD